MGHGDDGEGTVDCSFVTVSIESIPVANPLNGTHQSGNGPMRVHKSSGGKDDPMMRSTSMVSMGTVNQQHSMPSLSIKASSNKLLAYVQSALNRSVAGTSASGVLRSSGRIKQEMMVDEPESDAVLPPPTENMPATHVQDLAQVKGIVERKGEELLYFGYVQEPKNSYKRVYTKVVVITNTSFSNYKPGKCKRGHNRSIHLSNIVRVLCYSDVIEGFVLQSRHDFDCKFLSSRRDELVQVLCGAIKRLTLANIPVLTLRSSEIEMAIHSKPLVSLMGWIRRHENAASNEKPSTYTLNPRRGSGEQSSRRALGDLPGGSAGNQLVPILPADCLVIAAVRVPRFMSYDRTGDQGAVRVLPVMETLEANFERLQVSFDMENIAQRSQIEHSFNSGIASDFANYVADSNFTLTRVVRSRASRFPKALSEATGTIEEHNPSSALSEAETVATNQSQQHGASSIAAHTSQGGGGTTTQGVGNLRGSLTSGSGLASATLSTLASMGPGSTSSTTVPGDPNEHATCEYCKLSFSNNSQNNGRADPSVADVGRSDGVKPTTLKRSTKKTSARRTSSNKVSDTVTDPKSTTKQKAKRGSNEGTSARIAKKGTKARNERESVRAAVDAATAAAAAAVVAETDAVDDVDDSPVTRFGRKWHLDCFRCTNPNCKKWLFSKDAGPEGYSLLHTAKFYPESGELICSRSCLRDFIITASLKASPVGDAHYCPGCAGIVNAETEALYGEAVSSCGYVWHSDHLKCSSCQHVLEGEKPSVPHHRSRAYANGTTGKKEKQMKKTTTSVSSASGRSSKSGKKKTKTKSKGSGKASGDTSTSTNKASKTGKKSTKGKKTSKSGGTSKRTTKSKSKIETSPEQESVAQEDELSKEEVVPSSLVPSKFDPDSAESEWKVVEYKDWPYCRSCYRKKFQTCYSCSAVVDLTTQPSKALSKTRSDASIGLSNLRASVRRMARLSSNVSLKSTISTSTMLALGSGTSSFTAPNIFGQSSGSLPSNNRSSLSLGGSANVAVPDSDSSTPIFALGRFWHQAHFSCHYCKCPFEDGVYYVEGDGRGARAFCRTHYFEFFMPKCHGCGLSIDAPSELISGTDSSPTGCESIPMVSFGGMTYHADPRCLRCALCHDSFMIGPTEFKLGYISNGEAICMVCHLTAPNVSCDSCEKQITNVGLVTETLRYPRDQRFFHVPRNNWHPECLTCSECHKSLLGGRIFALHRFKSDDESEIESRKLTVFLCERDCVKRIKGHGSCTGCGQSLVHFFDNNGFDDDKKHGYHIVIYEDKPWHRSCFRCQFEDCTHSLLFDDNATELKPTRSSISLSSVTTSTTQANVSNLGGQSLVSRNSNGPASSVGATTAAGDVFASSFKHTSGHLYCWRHALKLSLVNEA